MTTYKLDFIPDFVSQVRDHRLLNKLRARPKNFWLRYVRYPNIILQLALPILVGSYVGDITKNSAIGGIVFAALWVLYVLLYTRFVTPWLLEQFARGIYEIEPPSECHLVADDEGIRIEDDVSARFESWKHIRRVVELPHGVAIFAGLTVYHVPISSFGGQGEVNRFVEFASARIEPGNTRRHG